MQDDLIVVSSFWDPIKANLAQNYLVGAGVQARLADEQTVVMDWFLANAVHGIKLVVLRQDLEKAEFLLDELERKTEYGDAHATELENAESDSSKLDDSDPQIESPLVHQNDLPPIQLNARQQMAERAFLGAVVGLLFCPIQLWVFFILFRLYLSDEPLGKKLIKNAHSSRQQSIFHSWLACSYCCEVCSGLSSNRVNELWITRRR